MQLEQMSGQAKLAVVQTELKMKQELSEQEFVQMALLKSFELSKPLSPEIQDVVMSFFQKKQFDMEQQAMADQQALEQQQMEAQQQQEQPE